MSMSEELSLAKVIFTQRSGEKCHIFAFLDLGVRTVTAKAHLSSLDHSLSLVEHAKQDRPNHLPDPLPGQHPAQSKSTYGFNNEFAARRSVNVSSAYSVG